MSKAALKNKHFEPGGKFVLGTPGNDKLRGGEEADVLSGLGGDDQLRGNGGNDTLIGGPGNDRMWGGAGDDSYFLDGGGVDRVIEKANGGIDTVYPRSSTYTLPDHVENLDASGFFNGDQLTYTGNTLDNRMTGSAFADERLIGLDGNDTLIGAARAGGDYVDGGNGDDVLIQVSGTSIGGAGADLFVTTLADQTRGIENYLSMPDFNGAEGDRLYLVGNADVAALFESGNLRFDAENNQLISRQIDEPGYPYSQTFDFGDAMQFDPSWITAGPYVW